MVDKTLHFEKIHMDTIIEIWSDVLGYEGLYQVSNLGKVKSMRRVVKRTSSSTRIVPELILAISIQSRGYPVVTLAKEGENKMRRVSRLVAIAHVPNPDNLPEVNHDDGIKINCAASNLSWMDRSGNLKHAYRTGLKPPPTGRKKKIKI